MVVFELPYNVSQSDISFPSPSLLDFAISFAIFAHYSSTNLRTFPRLLVPLLSLSVVFSGLLLACTRLLFPVSQDAYARYRPTYSADYFDTGNNAMKATRNQFEANKKQDE